MSGIARYLADKSHDCSHETIEILAGLGIHCGFRTNMVPPDVGGQLNPNRYEMAREDHANIQRMLGAR